MAFDEIAFMEAQMDKNNPRSVRLEAINKINDVAAKCGPEKVQTDLIPLICKLIPEEEDEILYNLAKRLGEFVDLVGGPTNGYLLLQCLELMCDAEETVVRDQAASSFDMIVERMEWNSEAKEKCLSMIKNLSGGDWFTKKVVAAKLYSQSYLRCDDEPYREQLRAEFKKLAEGKDELPMVKRSCASCLKDLASAAAQTENATAVLRDDIMGTLQIYLKDKDSSVRVNATSSLVGLIEGWCGIDEDSAKMCFVFTHPFVIDAMKDDSWRVRHALMKGYGTIAQAYVKSYAGGDAEQQAKVEKFLVKEEAPIEDAFCDPETEVRMAAVKASTVLGDALGGDCLKDSVVIDHLKKLGEIDQNTAEFKYELSLNVFIAVIEALIELMPLGPDMVDKIGDSITASLSSNHVDDTVIIGIMRALEKGMKSEERPMDFAVFGPEGSMAGLLDTVVNFQTATADDEDPRDWRVRKNAMTLFSIIMAGYGKTENAAPEWLEGYKGQLGQSMRKALGDHIAQVRVGAVECLPRLNGAFGLPWVKSECLAHMRQAIEGDEYYNYQSKDATDKPDKPGLRLGTVVALHSKWIAYFESLGKLITEQIDSETAKEWAEVLLQGVEVPTANVRFNAIFAMGKLATVADDDLLQKSLKPAIEMMANEDVDEDCKYFAKTQLEVLESTSGY